MVEGDLRQQTLEFLSVNTFREPSAQELEALEPKGYDTVLSTSAKRLFFVVQENLDHFYDFEADFLLRKPQAQIRDYQPPVLTVVLRSQKVFLEDSFTKPKSVQLQMTEVESRVVQELVPDARAIMLPASTLAQLDLRFLEKKGRVLFSDKFARALEESFDTRSYHVGRTDTAGSHLKVLDGNRDWGVAVIGALSAVVFIQK